MSLFFFRPWAGVDDKGPGGVTPYLTPADPIYYTRSASLSCIYNKHFEPVLVCCGFFLTVR